MTEAAQPARVTYREVLRVREFRAILLSQGLSILGDQIARIAIALLIFDRTGSAFLASATYAIGYLTWLVAGPVLSATADRYVRLDVMVACDFARAVLVALLIVATPPTWLVFAVVALVGLLSPPFDSARSATLPDVLTGERYVVGNGIINVVVQSGQVLGFLTGGALVATIGVRRSLLLDAASFLVSAGVLLLWLQRRPSVRTSLGTSLWQETREGLAVVRSSPRLRSLLGYATLGMGTVIAPEGLAVATSSELGGGAAAAGALTAAVPIGFVLGSVLVLRIPHETRERWVPGLLALSAAPLLATPLASSVEEVFALWVLAGTGSALQLITNAAYLQAVPSAARGRAFGVAVTSLMGVQGAALLATGALAEVTSPSAAVAAAAVLALVVLAVLQRGARDNIPQAEADIVRGRTG